MLRLILSTTLFAFACFAQPSNIWSQSQSPPVPPAWQTHAERTNYRETPRYNETLEYARRLDAASPLIRLTEFGRSGENRALPLLVAATNGDVTPEAAKRHGKIILLVQACIHAGESDGKDAGLALLRDIAITRTRVRLLDKVVLLFIPIYNVDGHERFGPYNRINQNGPAKMGWRTNATNLNLNRDYLKADAPETRAWLRLWNTWTPDLFIDCHVTDGADYRYNITYQYEHGENVPQPIREWSKKAFEERIVPVTEAAGNQLAPYLEFRDGRDFAKGINRFLATPRFSTGYTAITRNRPGLLIETHMLKDYRTRVRATYDLLYATLAELNRDPHSLRQAVRRADQEAIDAGGDIRRDDPTKLQALAVELTETAVPFALKGYQMRREQSDVSGQQRVIYGTKPENYQVPFYAETRASKTVAPPLYYIVPPQWRSVIDVLAAHNLVLQRLTQPLTVEVESYRFRDVKWSAVPFEGRLMVSYEVEPVRESRRFPVGSIVIPMQQANARVAMHALEPEAPDALLAWGFFNSIFEQKEYAESYVLEKLAAEMLGRNQKLRREFEERIRRDENFAGSPRERLGFFYERSPYRDQQLNLYPVARVNTRININLLD